MIKITFYRKGIFKLKNAFFLLICNFIFAQQLFFVEGEMINYNSDGYIYYNYLKKDNYKFDSAKINQNKFLISIENFSPFEINIFSNKIKHNKKNKISFYIEQDTAKAIINSADFSYSQISVNKSQGENIAYLNSVEELDSLIKDKNESINKLNEDNFITDNKKILKQNLRKDADSLYNAMFHKSLDFINRNPQSYVSLNILAHYLYMNMGRYHYSEMINAYDKIDLQVRKNELGSYIIEKLQQIKKSQKGNLSINFNFTDINGVFRSLNDYKRKNLVLLDFWATWCLPCKEMLPYLKKINKQFESQGLEIISISRDDDTKKWRENVLKEGMNQWTNFILDKNNSKKILENYSVREIPVSILIDRRGKIIGRWSGFTEQQMVDLENTIKEKINDYNVN